MIWRMLRPQGAAGLALCAVLLVVLAIEQRQGSRWRSAAQRSEAALKAEQAASAQTIADLRVAAAAAKAADAANLQRVAAEQSTINQRSSDDFETRISDARALAVRLQQQLAAGAANTGHRGATTMPGVPTSAQAAAGAAAEDRFSLADRLIATEQAVQLDALIKWVRAQSAVDPGNAPPPAAGVR